ncbi:hypothetical protein LDENG_00226950 [Lucifuga dentata]|nr:hypothetical protein LDENG_00226950 [Lucifuga dentata]
MEIVIHVFISSCLNYYNSLFTCLSKTSLDQLQVVQNAAAKLPTRSSKWSHVIPLLISLHWLPIKFKVQFKVLVFTFRVQAKTKGDRAFAVMVSKLWNSLPSNFWIEWTHSKSS